MIYVNTCVIDTTKISILFINRNLWINLLVRNLLLFKLLLLICLIRSELQIYNLHFLTIIIAAAIDNKNKDYETKLRELHAETEQLGQFDETVTESKGFNLPIFTLNDNTENMPNLMDSISSNHTLSKVYYMYIYNVNVFKYTYLSYIYIYSNIHNL